MRGREAVRRSARSHSRFFARRATHGRRTTAQTMVLNSTEACSTPPRPGGLPCVCRPGAPLQTHAHCPTCAACRVRLQPRRLRVAAARRGAPACICHALRFPRSRSGPSPGSPAECLCRCAAPRQHAGARAMRTRQRTVKLAAEALLGGSVKHLGLHLGHVRHPADEEQLVLLHALLRRRGPGGR